MEQICLLLESVRMEDRIAAIFLTNTYLDEFLKGGSQVKVKKLLKGAIERLGKGELVIKMVKSDKYPDVQKAGVIFLLNCSYYPTFCKLFMQHLPILFDWLVGSTTISKEIRLDIYSTIRNMSSHCHDNSIITILDHLFRVDAKKLSSCTFPSELLQLTSDLIQTIQHTSYPITSTNSELLRTWVIQGLHGAAKEVTRDQTLQSLMTLFQHQHILSPAWTISHLPNPADTTTTKKKLSSFPLFLVSIVYNELHLLFEELLYFARMDFLLLPPTPEDDRTLPNTQDIPARKHRCMQVCYICASLLEHFLQFLLPPNAPDQSPDHASDTPNTSTTTPWHDLPHEDLLAIQKKLLQVNEEMIDVVEECGKSLFPWYYTQLLTNPTALTPVMLHTGNLLRMLVSRCVQSIREFIVEEESLCRYTLQRLTGICQCSLLFPLSSNYASTTGPSGTSGSMMHQLPSTTMLYKIAPLLQFSLSSSSVTTETSAYTTSNSNSSNSSNSSMQEMDIIYYLFPILQVLLDNEITRMEEDDAAEDEDESDEEMKAEEGLDSDDEVDITTPELHNKTAGKLSKREENSLVDLLIEHNPAILSLVRSMLAMLLISEDTRVGQSKVVPTVVTTMSHQSLFTTNSFYSATMHFTTMGLSILLSFFQCKENSLKILLQSEGSSAFPTIFHLPATVYQKLYHECQEELHHLEDYFEVQKVMKKKKRKQLDKKKKVEGTQEQQEQQVEDDIAAERKEEELEENMNTLKDYLEEVSDFLKSCNEIDLVLDTHF